MDEGKSLVLLDVRAADEFSAGHIQNAINVVYDQVASLTGVQSPAHRWPQMAVDDGMAADAPARRGQAVFTTQCMPCHRMKGAGAADVGPDLGEPMNPTHYMSPLGLRSLIRNPKAVRTWPQQQMPAFDAAMLSDADLDAVIAYLGHMAQTPR
jgi:mono/diheme cytochrome c family protein